MASFDLIGWLGGVASGGWIPGIQPAQPPQQQPTQSPAQQQTMPPVQNQPAPVRMAVSSAQSIQDQIGRIPIAQYSNQAQDFFKNVAITSTAMTNPVALPFLYKYMETPQSKEAIEDLKLASEQGRKGDVLNALGNFQKGLSRTTTANILPDINRNKRVSDIIDDIALRSILPPFAGAIPQVNTYLSSPAGKDASKTTGIALRGVYEDIRTKPIEDILWYVAPGGVKTAEYAIEKGVAKAALSSSRFWSTAGKALSTPTAAEAAKLLKVGVMAGTGYMAASDIANAPNTPEGKGKAISDTVYPLVMMSAGIPFARSLKFPKVENPYVKPGEKGILGSAYDQVFNPKSKPAPKPIIQTPLERKIARWETQDIFEAAKPQTKGKIVDVLGFETKQIKLERMPKPGSTGSRFLDTLDYIKPEKKYRIPGTKVEFTKKQAIKTAAITGGVIGGTALGYLYSPQITQAREKIQKSPYSPLLSGLLIGTAGTKLKFSEKLKPEYDKTIYKFDKDLNIWRLITPLEQEAYDLKNAGSIFVSGGKQQTLKLKQPTTNNYIYSLPNSIKTNTLDRLNLNFKNNLELKTTPKIETKTKTKQTESLVLLLNNPLDTIIKPISKQNLNQNSSLLFGRSPPISAEPPKPPTTIIRQKEEKILFPILPSYTDNSGKSVSKKRKIKSHWETAPSPTATSTLQFIFGGMQKPKSNKKTPVDLLFGSPKKRIPAKISNKSTLNFGAKKMTNKKVKTSDLSSGLFKKKGGMINI